MFNQIIQTMKMKNQIKVMALFTVLGLVATSCTKESAMDGIGVVATTQSAVYIVDGQQHYANPQTDEEWSAFLDSMFALVEEGHTVQFWRSSVQTSSTKEKVTYTTTSLSDAKAWCDQKANEDYIVTMTYNQETGEYNCIAVK